MALPRHIKIYLSSRLTTLPDQSGVYIMKDRSGVIIYIGKATSLKSRVSSYFNRTTDPKTARLVADIATINLKLTGSILEATLLEAELIRRHRPKYNIKAKDDRSWIYLCITKDTYPRLLMVRGQELNQYYNQSDFQYIFGPYQSQKILATVLQIIRKIFPWSNCRPGTGKPCFYRHLGQCPGICTGEISPAEYRRIIRRLVMLFRGDMGRLLKSLTAAMSVAAKRQDFETAARLRNQISKLRHIQDIALLQSDPASSPASSLLDRIEGYDISETGGTSAVGSLVVFKGGEPDKNSYRKFNIRSLDRLDDTARLAEVLTRRFAHHWPYPDLIMVDGGRGQVSAAKRVLASLKISIPVLGIAKGPARKRNDFIFGFLDPKLRRAVLSQQSLLIKVRDEAHRFAIAHHRSVRARRSGTSPLSAPRRRPQSQPE